MIETDFVVKQACCPRCRGAWELQEEVEWSRAACKRARAKLSRLSEWKPR